MSRSTITAVVFDAVGTLLHPRPAAATVYAAVGQRHGSRLTPAEVAPRFRAAFAREEDHDRLAGLRTSAARELERWRRIVTAVLDDVTDVETCFHELYEHFAQPEAWRCAADTESVLSELTRRGYRLGLASNYDSRLRRVVAGLVELHPLHALVISSEVGWRKPAPEFFTALCRTLGQEPARILFVGDDRANDYDGARSAGLHALLFDPDTTSPLLASERVRRLHELLDGILP